MLDHHVAKRVSGISLITAAIVMVRRVLVKMIKQFRTNFAC